MPRSRVQAAPRQPGNRRSCRPCWRGKASRGKRARWFSSNAVQQQLLQRCHKEHLLCSEARSLHPWTLPPVPGRRRHALPRLSWRWQPERGLWCRRVGRGREGLGRRRMWVCRGGARQRRAQTSQHACQPGSPQAAASSLTAAASRPRRQAPHLLPQVDQRLVALLIAAVGAAPCRLVRAIAAVCSHSRRGKRAEPVMRCRRRRTAAVQPVGGSAAAAAAAAMPSARCREGSTRCRGGMHERPAATAAAAATQQQQRQRRRQQQPRTQQQPHVQQAAAAAAAHRTRRRPPLKRSSAAAGRTCSRRRNGRWGRQRFLQGIDGC